MVCVHKTLQRCAVNPEDRCKLFCRVSSSSAYYQLAERVIDGTKCGPDTSDVCVMGQCRVCIPIHWEFSLTLWAKQNTGDRLVDTFYFSDFVSQVLQVSLLKMVLMQQQQNNMTMKSRRRRRRRRRWWMIDNNSLWIIFNVCETIQTITILLRLITVIYWTACRVWQSAWFQHQIRQLWSLRWR